jgi:hypothetical protein
VDVEGNGSVDASGGCAVPGMLSWLTPDEGAEYAADGFSASWTDSAAGGSGYSIQYYVVFASADGSTIGGIYTGTERSFTPDPPLVPNSYRGTLQTAYNTSSFSGVSVQGQLVCGASAGPEVVFSIK